MDNYYTSPSLACGWGVKKKLVLQTAGVSPLGPHRKHVFKCLEDQLKEDILTSEHEIHTSYLQI
jgi:hypothetical protein